MKYILKKQFYFNLESFSLFLFLLVIFLPKIDLISIPGYWQGIRTEDIILFLYSLTIITNYREKIINNLILQKFAPLIFYFIIIFFSSFVGKISDLPIVYLSLARVLEYFVLIVLLCNLKIRKNDLLIYLKIYVLLSLAIVILQKLGLVGSFTSLGYLSTDHVLSNRVMGLTGGSWELGVVISLCYFIIITLEKPKLTKLIIYFFIALYLNLEAQGRMNFIGFVVANLFFLKAFLKNRDYLILLLSILTFSLILIFFIDFLNNDAFQRLINTNYIASLEILKNFILFIELPERHTIDDSVLSLWYRLSLWEKLIQPYFSNFYTVVFGNGTNAIYYESTMLRVLFTTGLVGICYVIYMIKNLELFILAYFICVGLTLDIFNSLKIFGFTILYFRLVYENYSYRRN